MLLFALCSHKSNDIQAVVKQVQIIEKLYTDVLRCKFGYVINDTTKQLEKVTKQENKSLPSCSHMIEVAYMFLLCARYYRIYLGMSSMADHTYEIATTLEKACLEHPSPAMLRALRKLGCSSSSIAQEWAHRPI
jgi:hypothetical protein